MAGNADHNGGTDVRDEGLRSQVTVRSRSGQPRLEGCDLWQITMEVQMLEMRDLDFRSLLVHQGSDAFLLKIDQIPKPEVHMRSDKRHA